MNEFTRAESELVDKIVLSVINEAMSGSMKYAQALDWDAAKKAVIELVKEKLGDQ